MMGGKLVDKRSRDPIYDVQLMSPMQTLDGEFRGLVAVIDERMKKIRLEDGERGNRRLSQWLGLDEVGPWSGQ